MHEVVVRYFSLDGLTNWLTDVQSAIAIPRPYTVASMAKTYENRSFCYILYNSDT